MDGRGRVFGNIFVERLWRSVKYMGSTTYNIGRMLEMLHLKYGHFMSRQWSTPQFSREAIRLGKVIVVSQGIILCSLSMCLLADACHAEGSKKHIAIAILPCSDVVMTFKKFYPLITYLERQTGFDIEMVVPKDYVEFEWAIRNGDIDFALQDPHTYVRLARLYKKDALIRALTREGETSQCGLIIARKGSGINSVEDLRGKTVMFGPKLSATKWVAAKEVFKENGINIDKDLRAYHNGGCCEDIAFNVYLKAVDAGVVCDHFFEEHSEKRNELGIDAKQILVIGRTKSVPTRVFAARKEVDDSVVTRVNQAFLSLDKKNPEHAKILYPAELGGFQRSTDEDYDRMRILIGAKQ
jgi:phosphonate transport system substrate-binding protein